MSKVSRPATLKHVRRSPADTHALRRTLAAAPLRAIPGRASHGSGRQHEWPRCRVGRVVGLRCAGVGVLGCWGVGLRCAQRQPTLSANLRWRQPALVDTWFLWRIWCPEPESNRHGRNGRGILSPLRLPVSPSGRASMGGRSWRRGSESNRRIRSCSPLHNHSATAPKQKTPASPRFGKLERETRLELATPTLARSCSTN